jgi:lysophospholipase L1-like esterase
MRGWGSVVAAMMLGSAVPAGAQVPYLASPMPAPGVSVCPGGLCGAAALEGWFEALAATEAGRRQAAVHIVQIGDSHTAGDRITGALRARLQARFGAAGRGAIPAGAPYAGYAPYQVQVEPGDWETATAPLASRNGYQRLDVGLAGIAAPAYGPNPTLRLTSDPGAEPRLVRLCGRGGPGADGFEIGIDGAWTPLNMRSPQEGPLCRRLRLDRPAPVIEVRPQGANALAYHFMLDAERPGVIVSNLGVVGATLRDLAARDESVIAVELADWRPSLIILAFGTNEGFEDDLPVADYERLLRDQIDRLRRLAPAASLLILGAPAALRSGRPGGCSADRNRAPPPMLAVVRDVQRQVAADMGVAFWDWHGRMGGDCSADRLAALAEPLMRGDRVHFTSAGSDWIGDVLNDDLMAAYGAWTGEGR